MNPLRRVAKTFYDDRLNSVGPSLTFARLCTSRHVDDLQGIAFAALAVAVFMLFLGFYQYETGTVHDQIPYLTGIIGVGAAIGWAYQSGSRRLGAVDLFASEISAICRVCLVVDFAKSSVTKARRVMADIADPPAPEAGTRAADDYSFTSKEEYTPVYNKNVTDLQSLDFDVVKSVTCFYTYHKTMLDFLRKIAAATDRRAQQDAFRQMIYMQYLMYESGRHAIEHLIEFEPDRSECLINILCSEFELYGFLKESYKSEFQEKRLDLRLPEYESLVSAIRKDVARNDHANWDKARAVLQEFDFRYQTMRTLLDSI